jgi:hypothetical protein
MGEQSQIFAKKVSILYAHTSIFIGAIFTVGLDGEVW